jgi:hypothetical protein
MANVVPGALWHPIDVGNRAKRRKGRGLIGHIAVVNSPLLLPGPLATRPSDWTFYLPKNPYPTGERFAQLIDLDVQCWSSADGNATCPAFESEGGVGADVNGPWTPNQVEAAAMILAHMHRTEGVPLQDMVNSLPGSRGFGVHRYGIDPYRVPGGEVWSKVYAKACPGDARVRQVPAIVARAQQLVNGEGDDMTPDESTALFQIRDYLGARGGLNTATADTVGYRVKDVQAALTKALPILTGAAQNPAPATSGGVSGPVQISDADRAAIVADVVAAIKELHLA